MFIIKVKSIEARRSIYTYSTVVKKNIKYIYQRKQSKAFYQNKIVSQS